MANSHPGWSWELPPSPAILSGPAQRPQPVGASFGQIARNLGACHRPWLSTAHCGLPTVSCSTTRPLEQGQCRAGQAKILYPHTWADCPSAGSLEASSGHCVCVCVLGRSGEDSIQNLENELEPIVPTSNLILTFWVPRPSWLLPPSCPHQDGLPGTWPWPPGCLPPLPFLF